MNQAVETLVSRNQLALKSLCHAQKVRELGLFGSAVTGAFDPQHSDLDFVVEFDNADQPGIADRFMNLASGLESIFHRKVDLITNRSLKNPLFKGTINRTKEILYAG
jgi:predicted nucleotidyltransferase